ncbi:MAG: hypothetical protein JNL34_09010 [Anaerolineae bacterium]|nr:hypothetical protein [Anaerolineae bacterium]
MKLMDETERDQSLPMVEINALRMEGMALYERCMTESSTAPFERFLERHLVEIPPPVALLNEISDDLFQRLQTLRQSQFELRDRLLYVARNEFQVELGEAFPLRDLERFGYFGQQSLNEHLMRSLGAAERATLIASIEEARQAALKLDSQRAITERLYEGVMDWATALHVVTVRGQWRTSHEPIVQNVWSATL